jgi:DNA-binding beta-propeller fold protein YncE
VPLELAFTAPQEVRDALAAIGRTEDVRFSPSGRRLAIAGFANGRIAVAEVEISRESSAPTVAVTAIENVESPAFQDPHGLDFIDEETIVVGNRGGGVAVVRLTGARAELLATTAPVHDDPSSLLLSPGSVAVRSDGERREVLACNNYAHTVTRHRLDASGRLVAGEIVARRFLDVPDGLALSADGRWLAVSNHNTHSVLVYDYATLGEDAEPVGILRGARYPHGIRFADGDRRLVVADAGAPFVHVFAAQDGGWEGVSYPAATMTVMDDETFRRGRYNPQEGGPKGIDVHPGSNVLAATAECLPLAFFDLAPALDGSAGATDGTLLDYELEVLEFGESVKTAASEEAGALRAELDSARAAAEASAAQSAAQSAALTAELDRYRHEYEHVSSALAESHAALDHVHHSTSWRVTAPLRATLDVARRAQGRLRNR